MPPLPWFLAKTLRFGANESARKPGFSSLRFVGRDLFGKPVSTFPDHAL
jgi:hypothetical protein